MNKRCYYIYRADLFARRLANSRGLIKQSIGGMLINFIMAFSYATVLEIGALEARKRGK